MVKVISSNRSATGSSLLELLVTTTILVSSMAIFAELSVLTTRASLLTTNKVDGMTGARAALNRITSDVRQARGVGDIYGAGVDRQQFPCAANPMYGVSPYVPVITDQWPGPQWAPMKVGKSVLVLQIPVTDSDPLRPSSPLNGMPLKIRQFKYGQKPAFDLPNVDTVVYEVVPDQTRPGEYNLQVAKFPGEHVPSRSCLAPQTILKGLVGPRTSLTDPTPAVFSYLGQTNNNSFAKSATFESKPEFARGVAIDLETKSTGLRAEQGDGKYPDFISVHAEAFLRNHKL